MEGAALGSMSSGLDPGRRTGMVEQSQIRYEDMERINCEQLPMEVKVSNRSVKSLFYLCVDRSAIHLSERCMACVLYFSVRTL